MALRSAEEIAVAVFDGDRDHIDAAGDPGFDDFILLGGIGIGGAVPEQLDAQ